MNNTIKLLYSLLIGAVAMGIAKLVHPIWSTSQLSYSSEYVSAISFS